METKRSVVAKGWGEGGMKSRKDFKSSENILYDTIMVDLWGYFCPNP